MPHALIPLILVLCFITAIWLILEIMSIFLGGRFWYSEGEKALIAKKIEEIENVRLRINSKGHFSNNPSLLFPNYFYFEDKVSFSIFRFSELGRLLAAKKKSFEPKTTIKEVAAKALIDSKEQKLKDLIRDCEKLKESATDYLYIMESEYMPTVDYQYLSWQNGTVQWNNQVFQLVQNPLTSQWSQIYQKPEPIKIEVSEEDKVAIINKLKENRAFNGDSAHFPAYNIAMYQELVRQKIIKSIDNKSFYLEENE